MFVKFHLSSNPKAKEEENNFTAFQKNFFMLHSGGFGTCNSQLMKKITDGSTAIAFFFCTHMQKAYSFIYVLHRRELRVLLS